MHPFVDQVGHSIHYGQKYILGKYLDVSDFNDRYHVFNVGKKQVAVVGETIFFPQVPVSYISKPGTTFKIANDIIHELQVRSAIKN